MKLVYEPFDNKDKINIAVASRQSLLNLVQIMKDEGSFDSTKGRVFLVDDNNKYEEVNL